MMQGEGCVVNLNTDVCRYSLLCHLLSLSTQFNLKELYPYKGRSVPCLQFCVLLFLH